MSGLSRVACIHAGRIGKSWISEFLSIYLLSVHITFRYADVRSFEVIYILYFYSFGTERSFHSFVLNCFSGCTFHISHNGQ